MRIKNDALKLEVGQIQMIASFVLSYYIYGSCFSGSLHAALVPTCNVLKNLWSALYDRGRWWD